MKYLFFIVFIVFLSLPIFAQNSPKTIYELYDITKGGCMYDSPENFFFDGGKSGGYFMNVDMDMERERMPKERKSDLPIYQKIKEVLGGYQKAISSLDISVAPKDKKLKNGNSCFFEKGKWGLKNMEGKILLAPQFDFVKTDTLAGGFVGYKKSMGNYYYGRKGKKRFKKDYYHILAVAKESFIIQGKEGFGLIHEKKVVFEPKMKKITAVDGKKPYFKVMMHDEKSFILLNDYSTKVPISSCLDPIFIGNKYICTGLSFFNLKKKKALLCENKFEVLLVDAKAQLLAIKKYRQNYYFLIDFEGNIISEKPFLYIGKANKNSIIGVAVEVETDNKYRSSKKYGLINKKGDWVVSCQYKFIKKLGEAWIVTDFNNKRGVIDSDGKLIIPIENDFVSGLGDSHVLYGMLEKEKVNATIFNLDLKKDEKKGLNYRLRTSFKGERYFTAFFLNGSQIIDEKDKPITGVHDSFKKVSSYILATDYQVPGVGGQKILYDWKGNRIKIKINGKSEEKFRNIAIIDGRVAFVQLIDKTFYQIAKDGTAKVFPMAFKNIYPLGVAGLFVIRLNNNKYGIVNGNGEIVMPFDFNWIGKVNPTTGLALFSMDGKSGCFTLSGELLGTKLYDKINYIKFGLYLFSERIGTTKKIGIMDSKGQFILPAKYSSVYLSGGLLIANEENKEYIFDRTGKLLETTN